MLELNKGADILATVGGITGLQEANDLLEHVLDDANRRKLQPITNGDALIKIANAIRICEPDSVFINSGSQDDVQWILPTAN